MTHRTFFKKLQIMLTDLLSTFNDFIKDSNIGDEGGCNYRFNNNMFDEYFFHKIEAHIMIYCKRTPLEDISTIIKINDNEHFYFYLISNH